MKKFLNFPFVTLMIVFLFAIVALYSRLYVVSPTSQFIRDTLPKIVEEWNVSYIESLMPFLNHEQIEQGVAQIKQVTGNAGKCRIERIRWFRSYQNQIGKINAYNVYLGCEHGSGIFFVEVTDNLKYLTFRLL